MNDQPTHPTPLAPPPVRRVQFDFFVGTPYASGDTGGWFVTSVLLSDVSAEGPTPEDERRAENQLQADLMAQGTPFVFTASAGHSDANEEEP